jgi:CRISPR-associated protein Csm3
MYCKLEIIGDLVIKTGLHIGGSEGFSAIGGIDSPVIRDARTHKPIVPGSSVKGKMRNLLGRSQGYNDLSNDGEEISRLFGSMSNENAKPIIGRLQFVDSFIKDETGDKVLTETKMENVIDRQTGTTKKGGLRQLERVTAGTKFDFHLIYTLDNENELDEDISAIINGFKLLEFDYLGGSGTRGYGRVGFENLSVQTVFGDFDTAQINVKLQEKFNTSNE